MHQKNKKLLTDIILLMRERGVTVDSPYDFENWISDNTSHSQLFATKLFNEEEEPENEE